MKRTIRTYPLLWVLLLTAIVVAAMVYSFRIARDMSERYAPLTDASAKIKFEVTLGHLWFEELISGDQDIAIDKVWKHLDLGKRYALSMLGESKGLSNPFGPQLRQKIARTLERIDEFRTSVQVRWERRLDAGIGTEMEQSFDQAFVGVLDSVAAVEQELERVVKRQFQRFKSVQLLLVVWVVLLGTATAFLLYRHERQRSKDLATLRDREERLTVSEHRYRALFERSNDAIFLVDKQSGRYLDANEAAERLTGRKLRQLKNLRTQDVVADLQKAEAQRLKILHSSGAENLGNVEYLRSDGSRRLARLSVVPLDDATVFGIARDITEEQATEQQLRRAQKMDAVGQLTGGIAHDFNNILGIILGNLDLLARQIAGDTRAGKLLDAIKISAERAANLTKQLLGFSRNQAREITTVDLNRLLEDMQSLIQRSITPSIEVEYQLTSEPWSTNIDADEFKDALLNLILNARDALPEGGHLTIETANAVLDERYCRVHPAALPGLYAACSVSDNGVGITTAQQERIFEPFYTTKERGRGTGLGLSMVFGFIKRSGGHIELYSEPGIGTSVTLYLPRSAKAVEPIAVVDDRSAPRSRFHELILLVDDEPELLALAIAQLHELGYRTLSAVNGKQALELLSNEPGIDLLLSDVVMPGGMDGYQLAERALVVKPDLKILLTSGFAAMPGRVAPNQNSSLPLLQKPYSHVQLAEAVSKLL
ncbi:MAG: PAS domain S-box protein [Gammaproteobacteria bacterium]|nr:PAS domain S-box protein [Gammaproteobacteria bacterium]